MKDDGTPTPGLTSGERWIEAPSGPASPDSLVFRTTACAVALAFDGWAGGRRKGQRTETRPVSERSRGIDLRARVFDKMQVKSAVDLANLLQHL